MRRLLATLLAFALCFGASGLAYGKKPASGKSSGGHSSTKKPKAPKVSPGPKVDVHGYTKKNGTHVAPHKRSYPGSGSGSTKPHVEKVPHITKPPHITSPKSGTGVQRDEHGRFKRSESAKDGFKRQRPCPSTGKASGPCPGYIIDHVKPLCAGGADAPSNMQWQTTADAAAKDKIERRECSAVRTR